MKRLANDETLPPAERVRQFQKAREKYDLFIKKLEQFDHSQADGGQDNIIDYESGFTQPKSIEDVTHHFTKTQKEKAEKRLRSLQESGRLSWTKSGEVIDPSTGEKIVGSDISKLLRYSYVPNKSKQEQPKGWNTYNDLLKRSGSYDSHSSSKKKKKKKSSKKTKKSKLSSDEEDSFFSAEEESFPKRDRKKKGGGGRSLNLHQLSNLLR